MSFQNAFSHLSKGSYAASQARSKTCREARSKHAAKHAAKHTPEHDARKDLRRAYEHLGRVEGIRHLTGDISSVQIQTLVELAKFYLTGKMPKEAADLLRAAEHFSFSALPTYAKAETRIATEVEESLKEEFEKLNARAQDHWNEHEGEQSEELAKVFEAALEGASSALSKRRFRQAMELARGAEALAHIHKQPHGRKALLLKAS